jgi:hypothetical protein
MAMLAPQVRPDPLLDEPPESADVARAVLKMEVPRPPADHTIDGGDDRRRRQRQMVTAGERLHLIPESLAGDSGGMDQGERPPRPLAPHDADREPQEREGLVPGIQDPGLGAVQRQPEGLELVGDARLYLSRLGSTAHHEVIGGPG